MKALFQKCLPLIKYMLFSGMTAVIESIIGLLLLNLCGVSEVTANTAGIILGAVVHYFCVTKKVFHSTVNWKTAAVYAGTFFLGMLIQNAVVWAVVRLIGDAVGSDLRYLIAKACSLCISFFLMYFVRKYTFQKISGSTGKSETL